MRNAQCGMDYSTLRPGNDCHDDDDDDDDDDDLHICHYEILDAFGLCQELGDEQRMLGSERVHLKSLGGCIRKIESDGSLLPFLAMY